MLEIYYNFEKSDEFKKSIHYIIDNGNCMTMMSLKDWMNIETDVTSRTRPTEGTN